MAELEPGKPLRSVSFEGDQPPSVNTYNTFIAGPSAIADQLPSSIGHVKSASADEIYNYFLERRNQNLINEAEKLITQMKMQLSFFLVIHILAILLHVLRV